jgi:hypothetical protein
MLDLKEGRVFGPAARGQRPAISRTGVSSRGARSLSTCGESRVPLVEDDEAIARSPGAALRGQGFMWSSSTLAPLAPTRVGRSSGATRCSRAPAVFVVLSPPFVVAPANTWLGAHATMGWLVDDSPKRFLHVRSGRSRSRRHHLDRRSRQARHPGHPPVDRALPDLRRPRSQGRPRGSIPRHHGYGAAHRNAPPRTAPRLERRTSADTTTARSRRAREAFPTRSAP